MGDETMWGKTHVALNDFFKILTCNKCKKTMVNPKQFLNCGHFGCDGCIGKETDCLECGIPMEKSEILHDSTISDLILNLNMISKAVGLNLDKKEANKISDETTSSVDNSHVSHGSHVNYRKQNIKKTSKIRDDISVCDSTISRITLHNQSIPKNINKKNTKGETALHRSCSKNQLDRVKTLLEAGADPNTKDNAGWTPLQEAASLGYYDICEMLLSSGAKPDMYGLDNRTALHEAVKNDDVQLASLLLRFKANTKVFDNVGKKPKDYSKSKEMNDLLVTYKNSIDNNSDCKASNSEMSFLMSDSESRIVLYGSNLKQAVKKLLQQFGQEKKIKIENNFSPIVSHVIIETDKNKQIKLSFEVLLAILHGKSLIDSDCLKILMESETITTKDINMFEVNLPQLEDGPARAKENKMNQHPQLFNNCYFYFKLKNYEKVKYDGMSITKDQLVKLVQVGDGIVLTREPKPEDIQGSLSPFHVAGDDKHSLYKCTHYIIYVPNDPKESPNSSFIQPHMYNMSVLKTLPLMWFIESILRFKLLDPLDLGLTN